MDVMMLFQGSISWRQCEIGVARYAQALDAFTLRMIRVLVVKVKSPEVIPCNNPRSTLGSTDDDRRGYRVGQRRGSPVRIKRCEMR
jgi:hypothetical protein